MMHKPTTISEINEFLKERVLEFKQEYKGSNLEIIALKHITDLMHEVIYSPEFSPIYTHPHDVNAIQINAEIDMAADTSKVTLDSPEVNRDDLQEYLKLAQALDAVDGKVIEYSFVRPLPFQPRVNQSFISNSVEVFPPFNLCLQPHMTMDLGTGHKQLKVVLFPNEIQSISFVNVKETEFSPNILYNAKHDISTETVVSPAIHYARFLGFDPNTVPNDVRNIANEKMRGNVNQYASDLWFSEEICPIVGVKDYDKVKWFSGLALRVDSANKPVLYEFKKHDMEGDLRQYGPRSWAAYGVFQHTNKPRATITEYNSTADIIGKLAEVAEAKGLVK
jgi:hypothetical protein